MKLNDMDYDELVNRLVARKNMPRHYAEAWLNKADELGLTNTEAIHALAFANSLVGMDLDSWIYGNDFEDYVDAIYESRVTG
jgi:hypothetical protein